MNIHGTTTALITPFKNQELDREGLRKNIEYQITSGVTGLLVLGTTGETATLSETEQTEVIKLAVDQGRGKATVWVGTGTNCTRTTIEKTIKAKNLGADLALIVTPYYNKPTQEGLFRHYEAITQAVDLPIVIYNIPGRTAVNIESATLKRIVELPNIIGIKESTGNMTQANEIMEIVNSSETFCFLSGDDAFTLPLMSLGAKGVISVVSNLVPHRIVRQVSAFLEGDLDLARLIHFELLPLYKAAFIETNPVPIKTAMSICGMPAGKCRLPLYELSDMHVNMLTSLIMKMDLAPSTEVKI